MVCPNILGPEKREGPEDSSWCIVFGHPRTPGVVDSLAEQGFCPLGWPSTQQSLRAAAKMGPDYILLQPRPTCPGSIGPQRTSLVVNGCTLLLSGLASQQLGPAACLECDPGRCSRRLRVPFRSRSASQCWASIKFMWNLSGALEEIRMLFKRPSVQSNEGK